MTTTDLKNHVYAEDEVTEATLDYFGGDELAANVWVTKYALRNKADELVEKTPDDMHRRLAREFARVEAQHPNPLSEEEIYGLLKDFKYIVPQGSPMYGIGNDYTLSSLSNCVVITAPEDNITSIMNTGRDMANLFKNRAGVGVDLSKLRPEGMAVSNSARTTSGAWSFADYFSNVCRMIGQNGRRGALMLSLDIRHPDAEKFATMKADLTKVTGANVSLKITDDFMVAVRDKTTFLQQWPVDSDNPTYTREIDASALWEVIVAQATATAEPGILLWDNIIKTLPADLYPGFKTESTNPCGEIPLCGGADSCRLISVNLKHFVKNPFSEDAFFDYDEFSSVVRVAMRLNDDLVSLEAEKLMEVLGRSETEDEARLWRSALDKCEQGRRTGLGTHGLADALARLCMGYDSEEGIEEISRIYEAFRNAAYRESVAMAKDRGPFPLYDKDLEEGHPYISLLPGDIRADMEKYGRRNISILTNAPTGSVSICSQTSSGIEPVFRNSYTRRRKLSHNETNIQADFVDDLGDRWQEYTVYHHNVEDYLQDYDKAGEGGLPGYFVQSDEIDWTRRIDVQAAITKSIDHSVSSCLASGRHMVHTSEGLRYIEDIASSGEEGFCAPSLDAMTLNHEGKKVKIDEAYVNGPSQTLIVTCVGGEEIIATPNHKLRVLVEGYKQEWKRVDELERGDLIVGRKGLGCFGNHRKTIQSIMGKFEPTCRDNVGNCKSINIPKTLTLDMARLLGYMISDGSVNDNGITLSQLNNNVVQDFENIVESVFGITAGKRQGDNRCEGLLSVPVSSRILRDYMEYLGITRSARTKVVPKIIFQGAGRGATAQFLKGLTLDGYVSESRVCVMTTVSKQLANEIVVLLNQFGIEAIIGVNPPHDRAFPHGKTYPCEESYDVLCTGENASMFVEYIGFSEDRKAQEAKEKFKRPSRKGLGSVVPNFGLRQNFRKNILPKFNSSRLYDMLHSVTSSFKNDMGISRDNLLLLHDLGLDVPEILLDPTYRFVEVKSVEEGDVVPTFDLHIKEGNSYVVNGLVSHNTINLPKGTPISTVSELYMRAWEKGLKGVTIYVDGSRSGVLVVKEDEEPQKSLLESLRELGCSAPDCALADHEVIVRDVRLPDTYVNGETHTIRREGNKYYLHLSYLPNDSQNPIALWIHSNSYEEGEYVTLNRAFKAISKLLLDAGVSSDLVLDQVEKLAADPYHTKLGKIISMALRHNIDLPRIVNALSNIEGDYIATTLTAVRKFLSEQIPDGTKVLGVTCSSCGSEDVIFESGCDKCLNCGNTGCQ